MSDLAPSPPPSMPTSLIVAAHLAETLPAIGLGAEGCLLALWLDADSLDFLDLLDGGAGRTDLLWTREAGTDGLLRLAWRPLAVEVAAGDPGRLMDALEFLARRADALLPQAQTTVARRAAPHSPEDPDALRRELSACLRHDLAGAPVGRPHGARFRAAALVPTAPARPLDPLPPPEVEDHRAIRPPRRRNRP